MATDLATRIRLLRDDLSRRAGRRDGIVLTIEDLETKATQSEDLAAKTIKAVEVVQAATEARREELKDRVENLITRGLRAVFARSDIEFFFRTSLQRDVFGVTPMIRTSYKGEPLETEINDAHGGGLSDVVSFILRVLVLCLTRPKAAPVLILDETFRHVSPEYRRGCATLLKELNRSAGVQFILVTHQPELTDSADVIYRCENVDGVTTFHLEHDLKDDAFHARPKRGDRQPDRTTAFDEEDMSQDGSRRKGDKNTHVEMNAQERTDAYQAAQKAKHESWKFHKPTPPVKPGELDLDEVPDEVEP